MTSPDDDRSWTLYLLRCRDGSLYAGITKNLDARVDTHNRGRGARYTRARLPVAVAWARPDQRPTDARRLEAALKRLSRAEKLRLVEGDDDLWQRLLARTNAKSTP